MTLWNRTALSDWSTSVAIWRISTGCLRSMSSSASRRRSRNCLNVSCMSCLRGGRRALPSQSARGGLDRTQREIPYGLIMKALLLRQHGGLENLQVVDDHPMPKAGEGHVVIRVKASSFNYHDVFTVKGMPGIKVPLPVVIGLDMAGEIVEIGPGVAGWRIGDRVLVNPLNKKIGLMGEMLDGGMEEFCLIAADQLIRMPDGVTFEQAAALPVAYGTAHRMLVTHQTVKPGDKVLVLGASGGVGTGCVILARMLGAEVIACAGSADKLDRLKALGANHVINTRETDFSK